VILGPEDGLVGAGQERRAAQDVWESRDNSCKGLCHPLVVLLCCMVPPLKILVIASGDHRR